LRQEAGLADEFQVVKPILFLTTPTSGTGSIWRIITKLAGDQYEKTKISEEYYKSQAFDRLKDWRPESGRNIYMYNTPAIWSRDFNLLSSRIILNFRDPRDLACNQYYWALQHPVLHKSPEEVDAYRNSVRTLGIDKYVLEIDNNPNYEPFVLIAKAKEKFDDKSLLVLSYNQLCLDIDNMGMRLSSFLGVSDQTHLKAVLEPERIENIPANPNWIGQMWEGSDTAPGRHKRELKPETIQALAEKYRPVLDVLRDLDDARFAAFYD
jgi:hypothetical protein